MCSVLFCRQVFAWAWRCYRYCWLGPKSVGLPHRLMSEGEIWSLRGITMLLQKQLSGKAWGQVLNCHFLPATPHAGSGYTSVTTRHGIER